MESLEERRFIELNTLFSYLEGRKPVTSGKGDRFMIVCYTGNYVDRAPDSAVRMVSVVDTEQAAHFIAKWVKRREKLSYLPKIYRTNAGLYPSESGSVSEHLAFLWNTLNKMKARREQANSAKQ